MLLHPVFELGGQVKLPHAGADKGQHFFKDPRGQLLGGAYPLDFLRVLHPAQLLHPAPGRPQLRPGAHGPAKEFPLGHTHPLPLESHSGRALGAQPAGRRGQRVAGGNPNPGATNLAAGLQAVAPIGEEGRGPPGEGKDAAAAAKAYQVENVRRVAHQDSLGLAQGQPPESGQAGAQNGHGLGQKRRRRAYRSPPGDSRPRISSPGCAA